MLGHQACQWQRMHLPTYAGTPPYVCSGKHTRTLTNTSSSTPPSIHTPPQARHDALLAEHSSLRALSEELSKELTSSKAAYVVLKKHADALAGQVGGGGRGGLTCCGGGCIAADWTGKARCMRRVQQAHNHTRPPIYPTHVCTHTHAHTRTRAHTLQVQEYRYKSDRASADLEQEREGHRATRAVSRRRS